MVKALEELAEEEQKKLVEEEQVAALRKLNTEKDEARQDTIPGSDVETPRSDSGKPEKQK